MRIIVRPRDSLWYYSQLFNIPLQLILDSNQAVQPNQLNVGQQIQIPGFVATNYTLKPGDTLWNIAIQRNISLDSILIVNQNLNPQTLRVGQVIRIPVRVTWRVINGKQGYNYINMRNDVQQLVTVYPFLKNQSIGNSVMGKTISELVVGRGPKNVHVNASFHAHEWITTPILLTQLNDYLLA